MTIKFIKVGENKSILKKKLLKLINDENALNGPKELLIMKKDLRSMKEKPLNITYIMDHDCKYWKLITNDRLTRYMVQSP